LLVHSEKLGVDINIAEGQTEGIQANPKQSNHLASVGKLFTATVIGMLHDKGLLCFDDQIVKYLDEDLTCGLHVFKGKEYTGDIRIKHLLMQTSGLNDVFFPLLKMMMENPDLEMTVREALELGKSKPEACGETRAKAFLYRYKLLFVGFNYRKCHKKTFS
jgi:D-alanyl-D-alanine carboxypeptidase